MTPRAFGFAAAAVLAATIWAGAAAAQEPTTDALDATVWPESYPLVLPPPRPADIDRLAAPQPAAPRRAAQAARPRQAEPRVYQVATAEPRRACGALCGRFILIGVGF
ncbi:MAG: hypothetical protein IPL88_14310 [Rhizobiales bacterium]|nr:hypothetical protein [Hyphomicrobiales bacterium]